MSSIISYCDETIELVHKIEQSFLMLGERLSKIRDGQLWEGRNTSFVEFLMEAGMTESTASKLIKVYQKFILEYRMDTSKLAKIPWTKLYTLLPLITSREQAEEKVDSMSLMSRQDIEDEIRDIKHPDCRHEWVEMVKCIKCFKTRRDDH